MKGGLYGASQTFTLGSVYQFSLFKKNVTIITTN